MANLQFSMKVTGLDELYAGFEKAGVSYEFVMKEAMFRGTTKIQNDARDNIRKNGTTYKGNLARSIRRIDPVSASRGVVIVGESYGPVVEMGRSPGKMPPSAPLERWAQLKLGVSGLGFVIAKKIAERGTRAQPYFEPSMRTNAQYVLDQFSHGAQILLQTIGR